MEARTDTQKNRLAHIGITILFYPSLLMIVFCFLCWLTITFELGLYSTLKHIYPYASKAKFLAASIGFVFGLVSLWLKPKRYSYWLISLSFLILLPLISRMFFIVH